MGVANRETIFQLLWAADTFGRNRDPAADINSYLVANSIFTPNIRDDSGQVDTWRDYQQILPELGLIVSTKANPQISLTPIALAFIDKSMSFDEVITIQALRYQYPNGYKSAVSSPLRSELTNTRFAKIETLTELHAITGVRIRPAVLVWQVLRRLQTLGGRPAISLSEADAFLLPAITHDLTDVAFQALVGHRKKKSKLLQPQRTTQEWARLLALTPLFAKTGATISITDFGLEIADEVDQICEQLAQPETFWYPDPKDPRFLTWYSFFGSVDVRIGFRGETLVPDDRSDEDPDDVREFPGTVSNPIELREFNADKLFDGADDENTDNIVKALYRRSLSRGQHILHDRMVRRIAETCTANGGIVYDDPKSLDLLVKYEKHDFLVEVKSVTPRNFVNRLRLALGQLLHYEYLWAVETDQTIRKVVAFPAKVHDTDWYVPFLNQFLDVDLLSLDENGLKICSTYDLSRKLFSTNANLSN